MNNGYNKLKTPMGYWVASPTPSEQELSDYYKNKYYQESTSLTYAATYSDEEICYKKNRAHVAEVALKSIREYHAAKRHLDVGCGEGFFMNWFAEKGWNVTGIDYSSHGVESFNPAMIPQFLCGDILAKLDELIKQRNEFEFITLVNVLEHVRDVDGVLNVLKSLMHDTSTLMIAVPNDFSRLQNLLLERKMIDREYWFSPPDHLNYFTLESLKTLLEHAGFQLRLAYADFPIELFLTNACSNYIEDGSKGKAAHQSRLLVDNHLVEEGIDRYINGMAALASLGMGRNISVFASLTSDNNKI